MNWRMNGKEPHRDLYRECSRRSGASRKPYEENNPGMVTQAYNLGILRWQPEGQTVKVILSSVVSSRPI